ncbi:MAG TPA: hypothetical protein DCM08_07860 [Microscillaceae bacterium]|jgi:predicted tellurium resistance membrane protein TerC|nr:hypothetical protein [Microscillaceae bacterium]
MEELFTSAALVSLFTLTIMEVVLGIDNVVFISIIAGKLPKQQQKKAMNLGLILALVPRLVLLSVLNWLVGLKDNLVDLHILGYHIQVTEKGVVLLSGGIFLIYKATKEIHEKLEGGVLADFQTKKVAFSSIVFQMILLNIVFSFDSILTAVGLARQITIMILAVVFSLIITLAFANAISDFVENHPTVKMLALSFLLLIGFLLIVESFIIDGQEIHVPKGYIYFAMSFSLFVELLNLRMKKNTRPVKLQNPYGENI